MLFSRLGGLWSRLGGDTASLSLDVASAARSLPEAVAVSGQPIDLWVHPGAPARRPDGDPGA
jgi:hypothetical protein